VDSRPDDEGVRYLRWRYCLRCHHLFQTAEMATGEIKPLFEPATTKPSPRPASIQDGPTRRPRVDVLPDQTMADA